LFVYASGVIMINTNDQPINTSKDLNLSKFSEEEITYLFQLMKQTMNLKMMPLLSPYKILQD